MEEHLHVFAFAGSLRANSYNKLALNPPIELRPEGMEIEIFDLYSIPLYNEDVHKLGFPSPVEIFRWKIHSADALLIATPEYNHSINGVF
jgi:chromate reductase